MTQTITDIPSRKDSLINDSGYPRAIAPPANMAVLPGYTNVLYKPTEVVDDWEDFREYLKVAAPQIHPRVLLMGHSMSEIENMTLMVLGGVIRDINGTPSYILTDKDTIDQTWDHIADFQPNFIGLSLYTGLTDFVFKWLKEYKIRCAKNLCGKDMTLEEANDYLRGRLKNEGLAFTQYYAPVVIGGHYNNYDYKKSWDGGGDFVVRGKGINLFKDILFGQLEPNIYHDPMPYANFPKMDREGFYKDEPRYASSKVKSIVTALGCNYSCTYCYISSMIGNLKDAYSGSGVLPPSIIQDRILETVLKEGRDIKRLDKIYGTETTTVFDQADISLNNIEWWEVFAKRWKEEVGIPFYIQARPAMLAGAKGIRRINAVKDIISGISMAVESGDPKIRALLLDRHESNDSIIDAVKNVKSFGIPLRTQCIVALPTKRPLKQPEGKHLSLVDKDGTEHYYDDPLDESLKTLELICSTEFTKDDYYWNALYSPFPGTPLGDYTIAAGFADDETDNRAYQFVYQSNLTCFDEITTKRQMALSQTSNFFAHLRNGVEMARLFLYHRDKFDLAEYAQFISENHSKMVPKDTSFSDVEFGLKVHELFGSSAETPLYKLVNQLQFYFAVFDHGLALLERVVNACNLHDPRHPKPMPFEQFDLPTLYRLERNHFYDFNYRVVQGC